MMAASRQRKRAVTDFRALGTEISLAIIFEDESKQEEAEDSLVEAKKIYFSEEKRFSRFDEDSELSRLNRSLDVWMSVSPEIFSVLRMSLEYYRKTEKFFDPRIIEVIEGLGYDRDFPSIVPPEKKDVCAACTGDLAQDVLFEGNGRVLLKKRLDLNGLVKGWITDRAADFFRKSGWKDFLVDSGGDIFCAGQNEERESWRIAVEGFPEGGLLLEMSDRAVATSGINRKKWKVAGEKVHHLIDPLHPEKFSHSVRTTTVLADSVTQADVWAKVLFLCGVERGLKWAEKIGLKAYYLDYRGNLIHN